MAAMTHGMVRFELVDEVATVTLDRPDTLNSMNDGLMLDIKEAVETAENDPAARVVVITGAGRGFCSGADLSAAAETDADGREPADPTASMRRVFNPTLRAIKGCQLPVVARINGVAAGGGLGLALACDVAIAARSAFFVSTFGPRLGIVPDLGSSWSMPLRVGRARALGMALLGDRIPADVAADWGLIWKAVDDDKLDAEVAAATAVLKRSSPDAVRRIRQSIDTAADRSFSDQLDLELAHQAVLLPANMTEGAQAFMEKREPKFDR